MRYLLLILFAFQIILAGDFDKAVRITEVKYKQVSCWSFCNLVMEMPWDTSLGLGPETDYINIEGQGAIVAVVDKNDEDTTLAVGVSWWTCNTSNRNYRIHYYQKNSRGLWYEVARRRPQSKW